MNSKVRERNSQQRRDGGNLHASTTVALYDTITPDSGTRSAQNAAHRIDNSCGHARARHAHVMDTAEERRKKCADGIKIKVHQRAGDGDPPEGGNAEHGPDGTSIHRRSMLFRSATRRL